MADLKTDEIPATTCSIPGKNSVSGADPRVSAANSDGDMKDPDTDRDAKRRKICPSSLEKLESKNQLSNSSFSFSFDTKSAGTPQFTPKFGSFKLTEPSPEVDGCRQILAESPAKEDKEEEEEESEISDERREIVGVLSSIDGIKSGE
ncbi:hypothetical protein LguiB_004098 [Lonicera macranthoides]